jgi:hypothetical protein
MVFSATSVSPCPRDGASRSNPYAGSASTAPQGLPDQARRQNLRKSHGWRRNAPVKAAVIASFINRRHRRSRLLWLDLRVVSMAIGKSPQVLLTILYCSTGWRCGAGSREKPVS